MEYIHIIYYTHENKKHIDSHTRTPRAYKQRTCQYTERSPKFHTPVDSGDFKLIGWFGIEIAMSRAMAVATITIAYLCSD